MESSAVCLLYICGQCCVRGMVFVCTADFKRSQLSGIGYVRIMSYVLAHTPRKVLSHGFSSIHVGFALVATTSNLFHDWSFW